MAIESTNPATGETLRRYPEMDPRSSTASWPGPSGVRAMAPGAGDRARGAVARAADRLDAGRERLRPADGRGDGQAASRRRAPRWRSAPGLPTTTPSTPSASWPTSRSRPTRRSSFVAFEPLGAVLAVMPWNFPFWQVFRFAAPALMAGNAGLLKHASNVPGCALAIEEVFREAGLPRRPLPHPARRHRTGRRGASSDPRVARRDAHRQRRPPGRRSARRPGTLLKKTVLELGGSDPYMVLEDADLEPRPPTCVAAPAHQQRPELHRRQALHRRSSRVRRALRASVRGAHARRRGGRPARARRPSSARWPASTCATSCTSRWRRAVARARAVLLGGAAARGPGAFYPATVLAGVRTGMPAFDEEIFGPVAAIIPRRGRGRGGRARQRPPLRPRRRRLHPRPRARRAHRRPRARGRQLLRQRLRAAPTRACPSAASRSRATAASCATSASASS